MIIPICLQHLQGGCLIDQGIYEHNVGILIDIPVPPLSTMQEESRLMCLMSYNDFLLWPKPFYCR